MDVWLLKTLYNLTFVIIDFSFLPVLYFEVDIIALNWYLIF